MFDFFDMYSFGEEIICQGVKWISVKRLFKGFHIAARHDDALPAQLFLIKDDNYKKSERDEA